MAIASSICPRQELSSAKHESSFSDFLSIDGPSGSLLNWSHRWQIAGKCSGRSKADLAGGPRQQCRKINHSCRTAIHERSEGQHLPGCSEIAALARYKADEHGMTSGCFTAMPERNIGIAISAELR
jgi:hypothetical protein